MKVRLLTGTIIVFLLFLTIESYSQGDLDNPIAPMVQARPIYIGPVVGYNKTQHPVNLLSFEDPTGLCQPFEKGSGNGFYAGLSFEYLLGDVTKSQSSIIGRVLFNSFGAFMERDQDNYPTLVDDPSCDSCYRTIITSTKHEAEITYNLLTAEVCYKLNPIPKVPLGITVGPTFDIPITKKIYQTFKLIGEPYNAQFKRVEGRVYKDNDRTLVIQDGPINNVTPYRFALKIGLQYEIITGTQMYIVPAVYYNLGITKVTSVNNWWANAIQIGVDVRWAL